MKCFWRFNAADSSLSKLGHSVCRRQEATRTNIGDESGTGGKLPVRAFFTFRTRTFPQHQTKLEQNWTVWQLHNQETEKKRSDLSCGSRHWTRASHPSAPTRRDVTIPTVGGSTIRRREKNASVSITFQRPLIVGAITRD